MATRLGFWVAMSAAGAVGCGVGSEELFLDEPPPAGEVNPSASEARGLSSMPACGTPLAEFDGTVAYSNAQHTGTGISCGGSHQYGYKYQCVELAMRHFKTKWGLRWWGHAKDLLHNAPRDQVDVYRNGDAQHPPVPGDMLVWEQGTYGHVALVTAVRPGELDVIEQNVIGRGRGTLSFADGRVGARWGSWVASGWAHAKANTHTPVDPPKQEDPPPQGDPPADPTPPSWSCGSSSYGGAQYWTCSGGSRFRCESGTPVEQRCARGCLSRPLGTDDLCLEAVSGWTCSQSAYRGAQYWTCSGGNLYRCDGQGPTVVRCPNGCNVRALGTDDDCR